MAKTAEVANMTAEQLVAKAKAKGKDLTIEQAESLLNRAKAHNGKEAAIIAKYGIGSGFVTRQGVPHEVDIVKGSLTNGENIAEFKDDGVTPLFNKKMVVQIRCNHQGCKEKRWVATSDLQNVAKCREHQKETKAKGRKRGGKRATASANLEAAEFLSELLG